MEIRRSSLARVGIALGLVIATPLVADEPKPRQFVLETRGFLVPSAQIAVSPKIAGQVIEMSIEEGQHVKVGQILARLDPGEQRAQLQLAKAKLQLAQAQLAKVKDSSDSQSKADVAIAEAKFNIARAELVLAEYRLDCTVVRAPINGVVMARRVGVGSQIDPKATQIPASVCELADVRTLEVEAFIPERDLPKIAKGQACQVLVDALPNASYRGTVMRLQPAADRARGALAVRVRLEGNTADDLLRPELTAIVQFLAK